MLRLGNLSEMLKERMKFYLEHEKKFPSMLLIILIIIKLMLGHSKKGKEVAEEVARNYSHERHSLVTKRFFLNQTLKSCLLFNRVSNPQHGFLIKGFADNLQA